MRLFAAIVALMAGQLTSCVSAPDMSRETSLAIVKLAKAKQ